MAFAATRDRETYTETPHLTVEELLSQFEASQGGQSLLAPVIRLKFPFRSRTRQSAS